MTTNRKNILSEIVKEITHENIGGSADEGIRDYLNRLSPEQRALLGYVLAERNLNRHLDQHHKDARESITKSWNGSHLSGSGDPRFDSKKISDSELLSAEATKPLVDLVDLEIDVRIAEKNAVAANIQKMRL